MKLILSAIPSELEDIVVRLNAKAKGACWMAEGVILAAAGVGFFAAYANLKVYLEHFPEITEICFVGTAGVYPNVTGIQVGEYVQASSVQVLDGAAEMNLAKYPTFLENSKIASDLEVSPDLSKGEVACLLSLTLDQVLAERIASQKGVQLENMELYAIALAAQQAALPWGAILGVTNVVGPQGHEQWKENRHKIEGEAFPFLGCYLGNKN